MEGLFLHGLDGPDGLEALLSEMAERLIGEGAEREVELLMSARAQVMPVPAPAQGQGGQGQGAAERCCLCLSVPPLIYERLGGRRGAMEERLLRQARRLLPEPVRARLQQVSIAQALVARRDWRERMRTLMAGGGRPAAGPAAAPRRAPAAKERVTKERIVIEVRPDVDPPSVSSREGRVAPPARQREEPAPVKERYRTLKLK